MSRLDQLKKQYPELNVTIFDVFKRMDPSGTYKYIPLFCKILGKRFQMKNQYPHKDIPKAMMEIRTFLSKLGVDTVGLTDSQMYFIRLIVDFYPNNHFETIREFISMMERNVIENKDVTSYSSIDDIRKSVSLAFIKELNRELENQVIKEYEDDKWVVVRPLTFSSSSKYGAATRWCTTYQSEKTYFERYWRQGILVYFINKETGYKFAGYKSLSENDMSFWNAEDSRVDYLDIEVDDYLFPIVRKIFKSKETNKNLCSAELQEKVHKECIVDCEDKIRPVEALVPRNQPEDEIRTIGEVLGEMDLEDPRIVEVNVVNERTWDQTEVLSARERYLSDVIRELEEVPEQQIPTMRG